MFGTNRQFATALDASKLCFFGNARGKERDREIERDTQMRKERNICRAIQGDRRSFA